MCDEKKAAVALIGVELLIFDDAAVVVAFVAFIGGEFS